MNSERALIASIVFLGLGLGMILGHLHDSTIGFNGAIPAAGASLQVVLYTNGWPAMIGVAATAIGTLLLLAALVFAVLRILAPKEPARGNAHA